ncbi:hypothetical protein K2X92_00465 [Candidatus Gracilibacteria bacterium]|nr:hypothetical protein [Candidatus Gracilibacteria bacterium]
MENTNTLFLLLLFIVIIWLYIWHHNQQKKKFKRILIINIKKFRKEYGDPIKFLNSEDGSTYSSIYREINNASTFELKTLNMLLDAAYSQAKITPCNYKTMLVLGERLTEFKNKYGNPMNYLDVDDREIWEEFSFENKAMIGKYLDILNRAYTRAHQISQINEKQVG